MYYVYILRCKDETLYCGYTTDVNRRVEEHNRGFGAHYTKYRRPVTLIYDETFSAKREALLREIEIKKLTRKEKISLTKTKALNS